MERQNTKEWLTAQWIEELKPKSTNICYFSRAQEGKRNLTDKDKCTSGLLQTNRKWTTTSSYPPWAFRKYLKGQKLTLSVDLIFLSTSTAKKGIKRKRFDSTPTFSWLASTYQCVFTNWGRTSCSRKVNYEWT